MKGPSIAVMLGSAKHEPSDDEGELSLSEAKSSAEDAATAFAAATSEGDAKKIVSSFRSLCTLCAHLDELEESGETYDDEETKESTDEAEE